MIKNMFAMRTFKNDIFLFVRIRRKDKRTNFTFKLITFTSVIIKIIFRSTTARTFNIDRNIFTISTFNRFNVIIFNKLFPVFMFNFNKRFNNSRLINIKKTIFNIIRFIIKMINFINFDKFGKENVTTQP